VAAFSTVAERLAVLLLTERVLKEAVLVVLKE
jgi:hypothetical protein